MNVQKSEMSEKLKKLRDVAGKNKSDMPWCGILVSGKTIMAMNASYSITLPLEDGEDWMEFVMPMDAVDLISNLPDCDVDLTVSGRTLSICGGSVKAKFQVLDTDCFHKHKARSDDMEHCEIAWEVVKEKLARIIFACATDQTKPIMTGVHFFSDGERLNMIACDGYKAAWETVEFDGKIDCVIEKGTVKKLLSICTGETMNLYMDKTTAIFKTADIEMCTRLLDGKYPDIHKFMPDYSNTAMLDPVNVLGAVRRVYPLCDTVKFEIYEDKLSVSSLSQTVQYSEGIELATTLRQPITIAFNTSYCVDMFNAVRAADEVSLGFDVGDGANLKASTVKAGTFQGLLLPMRIGV